MADFLAKVKDFILKLVAKIKALVDKILGKEEPTEEDDETTGA